MKIEQIYKCPVCGAGYDTKEKAEFCLAQDIKCPCEKQKSFGIGFGVRIFFDGTIERDVVYSNPDYDNPQYSLMAKINNCPFCGRKLSAEPKEVKEDEL